MCLLNHCSVQTEFSDINPTETVAISNLNSKILLQSFLLPVLIFITLCFAAPAAVSQETTDSDLSQSLEEDPFAEERGREKEIRISLIQESKGKQSSPLLFYFEFYNE